MYILVFCIVLGLVSFFTNKKNGVEASDEFLSWPKKAIIILIATFGVACLCEILSNIFLPMFFIAIYAVSCVIAMVYVNKLREEDIQKRKQEMDTTYEALAPILKGMPVDYNNSLVKLKKEKNLVTSITVQIVPEITDRFNDSTCAVAAYNLMKYFSYFDWIYDLRIAKHECEFISQRQPPKVAYWVGDNQRSGTYIPLGLCGSDEIGWRLSSKDPGVSSYRFEDGTAPGTYNLPAAPMGLVVGATGSGKAIWTEQELF